MSRKSNLIHQFLKELQKETKFSESKSQAKADNRMKAAKNHEKYEQVKGIYSYKTYKDYAKAVKTFAAYVTQKHTEVKTMEQAKKYVPEYMESLKERGLSAWTQHMYLYALRSCYRCDVRDFDVTLPERKRADVIRCRDAESNVLRNDERYQDIIKMAIATGARRNELLRLRKEDFREQTDENGNKTGHMEVYKRGKNGYEKWCLVNPKYTTWLKTYLTFKEEVNAGKEKRIYEKRDIPQGLPVHDLRADYAKDLYEYYERNGYADGRIYRCRGELNGITYDKGILEKVSENLQHHRNNVVVSYLFKK